jgi:hypothetical protein
MIPDTRGESEPVKTDPGHLARALELELLQKRAQWQEGLARRRMIRAVSLVFLVIILGIGAIALSLLFTRMREASQIRPPPSPTSSPGK